ncbi:cationic peroxidase 1-like [Humulus lupulus]|uniref:cationic peroxidase 1-like n=1 Tax=Humulus lupulus TaxID=3486 RepID=UPI002B40B428|nr:cationic peroxidase 1-like [Humulus lupulus]
MGSKTGVLYVVALVFTIILALETTSSSADLSPNYYDYSCPAALPAIKKVVEAAVSKERRMGASLLRLHFHDCFVQGCDGSILLDSSDTIDSEKLAIPNANSIRGFEVIDDIKAEVDRVCGGSVVSCADILAVAARDSVAALAGPSWVVPLGRKDSTTANRDLANRDIPPPFLDLAALIANFKNQGLDERDLVLLSGAHTLGFAQCTSFRARVYNDTNIDPAFAEMLKGVCPTVGGDTNLSPLDPSPAEFDQRYFTELTYYKGLLHSDQELFKGGATDELVRHYSINGEAFTSDFSRSMIKMGNIKPLTGYEGQVRINCRKVNQ